MVVKKLSVLWLILVFGAGVYFGQNIFQVTNLQTIAFNTSKGYVENRVIARLAYNKFTFYTNRYLTNFFAGLDPNYFFFGGHPREVPGGNNEMKISYWLLPFFLLGIYEQLLAREVKILIAYLATLGVASFFAVDTLWFFLVPFWYLTILYPLRPLWKK